MVDFGHLLLMAFLKPQLERHVSPVVYVAILFDVSFKEGN